MESDDISPEEYEALRASYREGVRNGTQARNTHATARLPPELADTSTDEPQYEIASAEAEQPAQTAEDADWDVSDYFSRSRPPEPDPETLE